MKKLLTILGLVAMAATGMKAQYALTGQTAATSVELVTCGLPDTIQFTLTNTSGATITNDSVHIVLPAGVTLSSVLPGAGYTATSKGVFIASIANSAAVTVRYLLTTNCGASALTTLKPSYVRTNTPAQTLQGIEYLSSLAFPVLQLTAANQDTSGAGQGSVYTRRYTLTNSSADARSYLQSVGFRDILQKGLSLVELKIGNTVVTPTISGDTVSYTFSNTELDADSKLNAGQSVIVYEKVRVSNICQLVNTQSSAIRTTWGCSNAFCETKTTTATAQKGAFAPYIFYRILPNSPYQKCSQYDTLNFMYFNSGNATAYDITGQNQKYGGDAKALFSNSITDVNVSFDGGATYQNTSSSPRIKNYSRTAWPASYAQVHAMIANGNYPATPGVIALRINYTIDSLNPGDTAKFQIIVMRLCNKDAADACGTNNQWGNNKDYVETNNYDVQESSYKDFCGTSIYDDWASGGTPSIGTVNLNTSWQITSYSQPTDVSAGNNFTASIGNSSNYIVVGANAAASDSTMYYMVEMTLPSAIQPVAGATKADFYHTSTSGGVSHGACDSFNYNAGTGKLKIFFFRNKWEGQRFLRAGSISARLTASCASGSGSGPSSIAYQGFYSACSSCGLSEASCVYPQPIQIHCPVAEPTGGIFFNNFDYYRTQFGLADYNNDGLPDGTARAIRDSVSDRRFIPGDTMEFVMGGRVYNMTPGQYPYGYAYNTFVKTDSLRDWGDLTHVTSTLYIRDLAAGLTYSMPITPTVSENAAMDSLYFRYNFSQDSIRGKGTVPSTYNFKNNDSIYIITRYRFMDNAEHTSLFYALTPFNLNNQLYLSGVANTNPYKVSDTANVESNDQWYGKVEQVFVYAGYRYTTWVYRTVCNTYSEITSAWGMIGGTSAWNYRNFSNEIRPYATFRNVYKKIDAGWDLDTSATQGVWMYRSPGYSGGTFVMTQGTHYTYNAATREVNVDMRKVLDDMYAPGFLFDEARSHDISFRLKKCAPTLADPAIIGGETGADSLNMDYIYPDIPLTGAGANTLSNGFTIVNTGANNTNLVQASGKYTNDNEPKINVQSVGSSTIVSKTSTTSATVKLINERYSATFATAAQATWLKIQKRNGSPIAVDSIQDLTTMAWIKPDSIGVFRTSSLAVLAERQYRLAVRFTGCVDNDSIQVRTSWNCTCASPSDTGVAQGWTTLKFTRQKPQLEIINTVTPNTGVKLCDTVRLSSVVNNAGAGRAYNVKYSFQMPNGGVGITPVAGQYRLYFPANSGTFVNLPAPTHNGTGLYTWDTITKYIANLDTGGMRDFSDTANSKFRVTYKIITSCGFTSGEDLRMFASEACGPPVEDKATLPIKLAVEDKVASNLYSINSNIPATLKGCNNSLSISTVFTNLASSLATTGASDSITIILPKGFDHVSTTPAPKKDTTFDGKVRLKWSVSGVTPGGTRTFNSTLSYVPNKVACGNSVFDLRATTRFIDTCIIDGSLCSVEINKDRKEIATDVKKPIFTISDATVSSVVNPMNSAQESITVNYTVTNSGDTSTSHTMRVYHDANADGMYNVGEPLLTSQPRTATIATGGTHTHSFTFNAAAGTSCPLVLVMDTATTCMCDARVSRAVSTVPFANGGADLSFCSGQSSPLGQVGPGTYLYSWFPGTGVANSSVPFTTVTRTNTSTTIDSVHQYILTTTRTGGGCVTSDTVNVTVKRLPVVTASNDTLICNGSSVTLTASGGASYAWNTIPVKTTASITETPTAGTNYVVTVTGSNGCSKMDTVAVGLKAAPMANAGGAKTRINCIGDSVQLGSATVAGVTYAWSPSTNLSSTSVAQPWAKPTVTTKYYLTVTNTATGCTARDSATVTVTTSTLMADAGADKAACLNAAALSIGGAPTATGGTLPYAYAWTPNTGLSNSTIANPTKATTTAGSTNHIVMITDGKGCVARDTMTVTINPLPSVAPSATPSTICNGASTTIAANATGGTGTLSYSWNAGTGASHTQTPTSNTTYNVTVTDANLCTATGSTTVTVTGTSPLLANAGNARSICNGASTTLGGSPTASGGSGSFTYAWSGGAGTTANPVVSPTATTTYTVTVTSSTCTATSSVVVTVNPKPSVAPSASATSICYGASTTISANATGGTGTLNYTWSPTGSGASFTATPTSNTTYSVTVSDANTCTATGNVSVTVIGSSPLAANAGNARAICNGASTTLGGSPTASGGSGSFTYAWSGGAGTTANPVVSPTATTTYTVTVTSSTCTATSSVVVTVNPKPSVAPSASATSICYGASTTISANATGGTGTLNYTWSPTGSGASFTATPTSNTTYSVTVSDANTCTATGNVSVTVIGSSPLAANAGAARSICNGASTTLGGSPTASGGAGGFTYAWSGGAGTTANPVVSPTATTTYTVTVTSSTCTATSSVVVTVNPKPSVAPSASSTTVCYGASTTISANATGGTTPYTYNWSPTGSGASFTTTPTTTTPYNVTVTDNNTCTASGTVTVNVTGSSPLTASAGNARAICNGASTVLGGSPTASGGAGGYTYAWDNGAGTTANPVVSPTATTTYTVTVTSSACTVTSSVVVTVNPKPSVAPSATATTICNGASTTVSANGTGGTGTLTYSWSPSGTGASFTASPTGTTTYNVTVSDANTCTASGNITVNVTGSSPLTANAGTNRTICSGTPTSLGSSPTGNGGNTSGTYTYSWTSSPAGFTSTSANPTVSPTATTTYTVTVTNTSCTATSSVVVTVNPKPTVAPTASVNPVCSGSNTTISANAGGGVSPYTYQWNTSQTSGSFVASPTATGSPVTNAYTVTVTDLNLCTVSGTINVTVTPLPVVASISPQSLCIPATGGSATLTAAALTTGQTGAWSTVTSPTGAVTYSAPTAATTAVSTLSPVNSYIFKWTVTESGCSNSTNTTVSVNEMPVIEAGANDTICRGASKSLSASLTSISPAAINWKLNTIASTPIAFTTSHTVSPTVTSNYIFTAAINSCIAIDTARVAVIQAPVMVDDMTACQSAIEDVQATFAISSLTSNDDNSPVLKGGVSYAIVSVKHGVASISGSDILYTGNTNYNGQDTVTIEGYSTLCPSLRDTSIFCVTITPVNDTPVAMNDTATTTNGVAVTKNILMNDTDVDNILSGTNVTVLSGPSNGTVSTVDASGNITYTSNANYAGIDSIVYQVCDGGTPNLCDTAVAYFYSYPKMTDSKDTVLMNSSTPTTTGSPISGPGIKVTASSPNGTVTVNPDGTVNYTPDPNFTGIDTITRIVCDTIPNPDVCNTSYIIMVVSPKVKGDNPSTAMNTPSNVGDPIVLGSGATQTLSGPNNGTVTTNPDGTLKYTPNTNAVGLDTIMRKVCVDGICDSALIVVQVTPVVKDTNTSTKDGTPVTISGPGLVPMAGSRIAYTPANTPSNGTATVNPTTGAVTYTPNPGFIGTDTIKVSTCVSYTGAATVCDTYLVIVKVDPKNITKPDINAGNLNTQIAGNLGTNDNVIAGTTYGSPVASASNPSSVLPTVNPDGTYTFTASVPGTYTFTISVCPPGQTTGCPTELLTITVIDPDKKDNKPIVNPDFPKTNPNTPISVNVLANDASGNKGINLDPKSVKVSTAPKNGTATVNPDGTISYTPNANFVGNDTFYYTVCDSATPPNCSDPVMVVVNVTTTPITNVQDDIASGSGTLTGNTLANDKFPAGTKPYVKPQDITIAGKGRFTIDSAGNYTWVPASGFTGSVQIPIQTCDGKTPETCYPSTITFVSNNVAADATIPNYFSPNGDGTNDVWSLDALLTRFPKTRVSIYNRWGNIVWRSTGPYGKSTSGTNIWYGQQEGSQDQIPDGVYYYLLELEDEFKTTKTGFIEVMRQ